MNISINPWYYCNFRCDFCYLTTQQLSDKQLLDLDVLETRLREIPSPIDQVDLYGGEIGLLPKEYFQRLKEICKRYTDKINIITNLSTVNSITTDEDCYISVSYDFDCRENHEIVFKNMMLLERPFSILMLAGDKLIEKDVSHMINMFNLIGNLESVEIKPYSSNQANQQTVTFKQFEDFIIKWIDSPIKKNFSFINEFLIEDVLDKTRNSFSDDHIYITPSGRYAVLEFDLNDNEFFLEYDTFQDYLNWCSIEKKRTHKNSYCNQCEYNGHCLSEHLRDVKDLNNSCNGFKHLIDWYKNERLEDSTRSLS
jgi:MoaA/NifB/PqqE/SkfB family radical SAM enzyme